MNKDDWRNPETEVPPNENFVLALISGRINGTQYESAPTIAEYWKDEGWFLTDIMPHKQDVWKVDAWMPIPEWGEPNGQKG